YNLAKLEDLGLISRRKEVSRGLCLNWDRLEELKLAISREGVSAVPMPASRSGNGSGLLIDPSSLLQVPVLGSIAAGEPIQVEALTPQNAEEYISIPEGMLKTRGPLFGLRVKGDSMIDASVLDGDIVVLRHQE